MPRVTNVWPAACVQPGSALGGRAERVVVYRFGERLCMVWSRPWVTSQGLLAQLALLCDLASVAVVWTMAQVIHPVCWHAPVARMHASLMHAELHADLLPHTVHRLGHDMQVVGVGCACNIGREDRKGSLMRSK